MSEGWTRVSLTESIRSYMIPDTTVFVMFFFP